MTRRPRLWTLTFLCAIALAVVSLASGAPQAALQRPEPTFDRLTFRGIGPSIFSGRVSDLAVYEANPNIFYAGTTTGGLWKTTNNGTTWEVLFNSQDDVVSIGAVRLAQDDPNVVWVGTGGSQSWGKGVYKSTDGGRTWKHAGLADTRQITRIVIDPSNRDTVYVAAAGHLWGPNGERGVFKTTDGGMSWTKVLFVDEHTGANDLVMDSHDHRVLYAAMHQRQRAPWGYDGGGPGSGVYKSTDAGGTWTKLANGLPTGDLGAIGLDLCRNKPQVVYAFVEHPGGKDVFRSEDSGANWTRTSDQSIANPRFLGHQPRFFDQIRVDPNDDRRLFVLGVNVYMSDDAGKTFSINESAVQSGLWPVSNGLFIYNTSTHSDHRTMWIDPSNSSHVMSGSDGGVSISYDRGRTWDVIDNMDLGQFYHVGYDMDSPYRVYGGLQDSLGWGGPSAVRSYLGIGAGEWFLVAGGDGFVAVADPRDSRTIYAESQNGNMARVDRLTNERQPIRPEPADGEPPLRWNFNTPMIISPHDPNTLLIAANRVFKSSDRGQSWETISPDLTAQIDPKGLSLMGVPARSFKIGSASATYSTIVSVAESLKKAGLYYVGTDDGNVQMSKDAGRSWVNIGAGFPNLPKTTPVSAVVPSRLNEERVYATFDGHLQDDYHSYVYASADYGSTWTSITSNLPAGNVVRCLTEDPKNPNVLYVGTEFGLFVTLDRGARWIHLRGNLPTVPISEIVVHPRDNDLIVATFGRGIWILDDLSPIQQASDALKTDAFLFDIRPAVAFNAAHDRWWMWGDRRFWGKNPPFGAGISYYLREAPQSARVTIRDAAGSVIRQMDGDDLRGTLERGVNRIQWNLRNQPLPTPASQLPPSGIIPFFGGGQVKAHSFQEVHRDELNPLTGPFVVPGDYQVTLTVNGKDVMTRSVTVKGDPLIAIADSDRKRWHDATLGLHELQRTAYQAAEAVITLRGQVSGAQARIEKMANAPAALSATAMALDTRLADLRRQLMLPAPGQLGGDAGNRVGNLPGQIASLKMQLLGATAVPTEIQARTIRELRANLAKAIADLNDVIVNALPALAKALGEPALGPAVEPIKTITRNPSDVGR